MMRGEAPPKGKAQSAVIHRILLVLA
jgi:hypothetical protein